jgi:hypothetical protein
MKLTSGPISITLLGITLLLPGVVQSQAPRAVSVSPVAVVPTHVLRFHLQLHAMSPQAVTVPAGKYAIDVINGVVLAPITVQLSAKGSAADSAASTIVTQTTGKASDSRVRSLFTLTPGTYTLGVRSRSDWTSTITVVEQ